MVVGLTENRDARRAGMSEGTMGIVLKTKGCMRDGQTAVPRRTRLNARENQP